MAHIIADRVYDTSTTTGTGAITVSGTAPSAYRTFSSVMATNDTCYYSISHQSANEWEVGLATYSATNQLTRTTVYSSSNAGSAVNFSAGTKDVFLTFAASRSLQLNNFGSVEVAGNVDITAPSSADTQLRLTKTGSVNAAIKAVTGALTFGVDGSGGGTERFRIGSLGQLGIAGANYGTSGQALVSGGASAAPSWASVLASSDILGQQTIYVPAYAMISRSTNGAAPGTVETTTNRVMLKTFDFDTTTQEFVQFAIQMPKGWNESTLVCQFIWSHAATTTNFGVVWAIEAVGFADNDAGDAAFGSAVQVADTGGTTNNIYITAETSALTVAGTPAAEEWVVFQVKRVPADGSDTMAIDARLHGVKVHYTIDAAKDD